MRRHHNSSSRIKILISLICMIMVVLIFMRIWAAFALQRQTNELAIPLFHTVTATATTTPHEIILPGTVLAWHEAPIYARTSGYIKKWYVDIGSHVKMNDLLAVIESPELDAQLRQAEAHLNVVIANNKLAQTTAIRWKDLLRTDSVSKQETDEKVDTATALAASVIAATAERDRLRDLVGYERVIAPFTGIISARATDIGALINSGSKPSEAKPLFRLVQINRLRLYVKIPQTYASRITPQMKVSLQFAEYPNQRFPARLLATANAITPTTRTLLAQFIVENKNELLLPGAYTSVHFSLAPNSKTVQLPINTLIFRKEGLQVGTVDENQRVVLKNISISRDFGTYIEVNAGVKAGEQIILNPPDSIYEGQHVRLGEKKLAS